MDSALQNKYFVSAASIMLITSSGLLKPIFPAKMLKNTFVKAAIVYAVFYMVDKNVTLSILLTVAYLTSLNIIEGFEEGKEGSENLLDEAEEDMSKVESDVVSEVEPEAAEIEQEVEPEMEEVESAAAEVESAATEVQPVLEAAGAAPGSEAAEVETEAESAVAEVEPEMEEVEPEMEEVEPEMEEVEPEMEEVEEKPATVVDAVKAVTKKAVKNVKKVMGYDDDDDNYKEVDNYPTRKPRKFPVPFKQEHEIKGIISDYTDTGHSF
jgi:ElaB/YqjD/DUF883 family membrane-anchored ribosome-binding protein